MIGHSRSEQQTAGLHCARSQHDDVPRRRRARNTVAGGRRAPSSPSPSGPEPPLLPPPELPPAPPPETGLLQQLSSLEAVMAVSDVEFYTDQLSQQVNEQVCMSSSTPSSLKNDRIQCTNFSRQQTPLPYVTDTTSSC